MGMLRKRTVYFTQNVCIYSTRVLHVCIGCEENFTIKSERIAHRFILNEGVLIPGSKVICSKSMAEKVLNLCPDKLFGQAMLFRPILKFLSSIHYESHRTKYYDDKFKFVSTFLLK